MTSNLPPVSGVVTSVLVVDGDGVLIGATEPALRMLGLPADVVGSPLAELVSPGRLADLVLGRTTPEDDHVVLVHDRLLEVSRARVEGDSRGVLVLVHDKSGVIELLSELAGVRAFAEALTAQHRDHVNRLHLLMGLLELGNYDDAIAYLSDVLRLTPGISAELDEEAAVDPGLSALLIGKANIAAEHGVELQFTGLAALDELAIEVRSLISILGNLIDNAMDAVVGVLEPRVDVDVVTTPDAVSVIVSDNGPGIPEGVDVFADGFSTKPPHGVLHRGLGLALVRHLVTRSGGVVRVHNDGGAVVTVRWPTRRASPGGGW
jgi:two-component system CitB family sensor kinase